jgi:hypothetical protein
VQLNQILFVDDIALVADEECNLQKLFSEFDRVCERSKLSVNVGKNVMIVTRMQNVGTFI